MSKRGAEALKKTVRGRLKLDGKRTKLPVKGDVGTGALKKPSRGKATQPQARIR